MVSSNFALTTPGAVPLPASMRPTKARSDAIAKSALRAVPDFDKIIDHYTKNANVKIPLEARYVYHPEQVGQIQAAVAAGTANLPAQPLQVPPGPPPVRA